MKLLNILAMTDLHYIGVAKHICKIKERKAYLAIELIRGVINSIDISKIDLIVLLGDLVDNGDAPGAKEDLEELSSEFKKLDKPVIVVPGNHDVSPKVVFSVFNNKEGLNEVEGYQFITFSDEYDEGDKAVRCMEKMEEVFSGADMNRPIIVLQHNPIYPHIDRTYPYNLQNAEQVMEYYTKNRVMLSISGHAHWGIPTMVKDNVGYLTCPALCEEPHRYIILTMNGKEYKVEERSLGSKGTVK